MVGIYVRVSTDEQAINGFSIRGQIEKLISYCNIKEWDIYKIYKDEGISGKSINSRPGLLELINDIKLKNVNNVLVYKIDRLTRSIKDLIELIDYFNNYNCSFNSLTENIDTVTSAGRLFIKMIGIFAEFERENIAERVRLGLERKVREGYSIASKNISYGYVKNNNSKLLSINQFESYVVKKIFYLFLNGYSYTKIANYLNRYNIKTKNGNIWNSRNIKLILINPNYIGKVRYGINKNSYFEVNGIHESIVKKEWFDDVQMIINKSKNNLKIYCGCGRKIIIKKEKYYLKNNKKIKYIKLSCTKCGKSISFNKFNKMIKFIVDDWDKNEYKEKINYLSNHKIIINNNYVTID